LLGLYIGVVKLHPKYRRQELVQALEDNALASYIELLHSGPYQSFYSKWFLANIERFR
jgi:hypothetical protein